MKGIAAIGGALALALLPAWVREAPGLPAGRAWGLVEELRYPRIVRFSRPRLEVDSAGIPILIAHARWDTVTTLTSDWGIFSWRDTLWEDALFADLTGSNYRPAPVLSLTPQQFLLWMRGIEFHFDRKPVLLWSEILGEEVTRPDTAMVTLEQTTEYSGAASARRRWVARSQQRPQPDITMMVRVVYSDTLGIWHELPSLGVDEDHNAIAPLSDTVAMLAYAGESGLNWVRVEGSGYGASGTLDPRPWAPAHPRFRFRPSGGLWLLWTEKLAVHVSSYRDGEWSYGDTLRCVHPPGETFWSGWCDASRDTAERPVLAWGDLGVGQTFRDVACVAFPTDSGWAPGEEVPGSWGGWDPAVTRDRNGDAWVAWWPINDHRSYYTHTYVSAIASPPRFHGSRGEPALRWTLSEPAPGSFWEVLRAEEGGEYEEVARVQADAEVEMSWRDLGAPSDRSLRYRLRRASVDARYRWLSEEATWWPRGSTLGLTLRGPLPALPEVKLELAGAVAGPVEVRLYDLQGRVVLTARVEAGGSGRDTVRLSLGVGPRLPSGVYFARARDSSGRRSPALKLVLLK